MSDPAETRLQTLQAACNAIVAYLVQHPCAADNEHGIAQWWLPDMGVDVPLTVVRQALQGLLQRQVVISTILPDGSEIFRAAPPAPAGGSH